MIVVVAEKPSVARDIAAVLGATQTKGGFREGNGYRVTWAIGHLVGLAEPAQMDSRWRSWEPSLLPMLPASWDLTVFDRTKDQFQTIAKLLKARETKEVVCATDAGREGELIWRFIYEASGSSKPVKRLWISSLTPEAIRRGFQNLKPSSQYDALAAAARARSRSDWLVGMNLSRAYSLASGDKLSVGRVQTPTLAMVVARDAVIAGFTPQGYREVEASFAVDAGAFVATYVRRAFQEGAEGKAQDQSRLPGPAKGAALDPLEDADAIAARARSGRAQIAGVELKSQALRPPLFFDLTELQRAANRLWGFSAAHTLATTQALYEKHKVLSYPRTDSRHLSVDVAATLPRIVEAIRAPYAALLVDDTGRRALDRRFVDDTKVSDHHAIIPTGTRSDGLGAGSDEYKLYDLVCRRVLAAWQPDNVEATTVVDVIVTNEEQRDRFVARGTSTVREGWTCLEPKPPSDEQQPKIPAGLVQGADASVSDVRVLQKKTRPPPHFTEATLLRAMETAGASLADELSEAMRERGLGTPATRAATIETLIAREYMGRDGKVLRATELGNALIARVHPHVRSPAMTGEWEARLKRLERGQDSSAVFMSDVETYVRGVVVEALKHGVASKGRRSA